MSLLFANSELTRIWIMPIGLTLPPSLDLIAVQESMILREMETIMSFSKYVLTKAISLPET